MFILSASVTSYIAHDVLEVDAVFEFILPPFELLYIAAALFNLMLPSLLFPNILMCQGMYTGVVCRFMLSTISPLFEFNTIK